MKELSLSVLILAFLISGCASVNHSVPETVTAGNETTILESTESPANTAETEKRSQPTNDEEDSPFNPMLSFSGIEIQDNLSNQLVGFNPLNALAFLSGFVVGVVMGALFIVFLIFLGNMY